MKSLPKNISESPLFLKDKELVKQLTDFTKEHYKNQVELFKFVVAELFAAYPEIKKFRFTGSIPHFNDGDPCVFSTTKDYPDVNGYSSGSYSWDDEDDEDAKEHTDAEAEAANKLASIVTVYMAPFSDEFFEKKFGQGFKVTITPNRVVKEDYDSDY